MPAWPYDKAVTAPPSWTPLLGFEVWFYGRAGKGGGWRGAVTKDLNGRPSAAKEPPSLLSVPCGDDLLVRGELGSNLIHPG